MKCNAKLIALCCLLHYRIKVAVKQTLEYQERHPEKVFW